MLAAAVCAIFRLASEIPRGLHSTSPICIDRPILVKRDSLCKSRRTLDY